MKNVRMTICVMVAVLVITASQGFGWILFKDGGTHNINSTINDDVWVDYQAPGMQTTVNLLAGGEISYPFTLQAYNNSRLNISGGTVRNNLYARGSSQITMSDGMVSNILYAWDSSQVTISGGKLFYLFVDSSSQVTISGGNIDWQYELLTLDTNAKLTIHGSDFAIDGTPFGFGEITSILGSDCGDEPSRRLTGTLANGDIINSQFQIGNSASIVLVPEPATLLLLGLGAVIMKRKR